MRDLDVPSRWPPPDFLLEVRGFSDRPEGLRENQALHVFADGIALFRRASRELEKPSAGYLRLPIYDTLSVYQLQRESLRSLGRSLKRADLFEIEPINDVTSGDTADRTLTIRYRALGNEGEITSDNAPAGALDRIVRIVNGYTPRGHEFRFSQFVATAGDRHLDEVPQPDESLADALAIHAELLRRHPDHVRLWLDWFALAIAAGDRTSAREALDGLRGIIDPQAPNLPGLGAPSDVIERLEAILATLEPPPEPDPAAPTPDGDAARATTPTDAPEPDPAPEDRPPDDRSPDGGEGREEPARDGRTDAREPRDAQPPRADAGRSGDG